MSKQKHTQGKWMVGECHQVLTQDGRTVADAGCTIFPMEEKEANAHLIASAPELHAILNNLVIACKICGMSGALIRNAEEVLKKSRRR